MIYHPELDTLTVAHLDCDSFYASVEKRDDPSLIDKPVIVGGAQRGVVTAACYVARKYGVHSAMPMFKALRLCPDAVVIRPDMSKYARVGREVKELMRSVTPLVESLSIDEAFLDLGGTERLHHGSAARTLAHLTLRIEEALGISITVGLSYNKSLAKIASTLDKPRGYSVVGRGDAWNFLRRLPVSRLWGVGKVMQQRLERDGIRAVGDIQDLTEDELVRRYGEIGKRFAWLSRGEDTRPVDPSGNRKSLSAETTFSKDLSAPEELSARLWSLSEKVSARLKDEGIGGRVVTLKLKTARFKTLTRRTTLSHPTVLADTIFRTADALLAREATGAPYRLIGVGVSDYAPIAECDPIDLADPDADRRRKVETAIDGLRARFGADAIGKGRRLPRPGRAPAAETRPVRK
jgi:DNA polymerase-4